MSVRIIFKTDAESSIGRGAVLYREHFEPRMAKLVYSTAQATEELLPNARVLRVTEGWRPAMHARDLHAQRRAFDFTIEYVQGIRAVRTEYLMIAERVRALVGDAEYDFLVHGEGSGLHIHAEYDPH